MKPWLIDTLALLSIFAAVAIMILGCSALGMERELRIHPEYAEVNN